MPSSLSFFSKKFSWTHFCYWFAWFCFIILSFKTATSYPEFIQVKFIGLNFWQLGGFFWLFTTAWQFITSLRFSSTEIITLAVFTILLFFACCGFYFFETSHELNAVLLTFNLHYSVLINLVLILAALTLWLLFTSSASFSLAWSWLLPPFFLVIILLCLYFNNLPLFILISTENNLIEWLSFIVLVVGFGFAIFGFLKFYPLRRSHPLLLFAFALFALALFFLAGEEISWGQRATDSQLAPFFATNLQHEITIHNLDGIQQLMTIGYILLGLWGSFSWLLCLFPLFTKWLSSLPSSRQLSLRPFVVPWFYTTWFFPLFLYGFNIFFTHPMYYKTWEETAELLCWFGLTLHLSSLTFWRQDLTNRLSHNPTDSN